jgi:hypothetical protein
MEMMLCLLATNNVYYWNSDLDVNKQIKLKIADMFFEDGWLESIINDVCVCVCLRMMNEK